MPSFSNEEIYLLSFFVALFMVYERANLEPINKLTQVVLLFFSFLCFKSKSTTHILLTH